jgi:hypothetical protein
MIGPFKNTGAASGTGGDFKVTTYTDSTLDYSIDTLQDGLTISSCETGYYLEDEVC